MRILPLFENGEIRNDAGQRLLTFKYFPEDEASRGQLYELMEFEKMRAMAVCPEHHEQTEFSRIVESYLTKSEGQKGVAGLVTLCFAVLLKRQKKRPTLYSATSFAARVMKEVKDKEGYPFFASSYESGEFASKGVRAVSGRGDIEKRFRTFSSIGGLQCAGFLMSANTDDELFPHRLEANITRTVKTMAEIEKKVIDSFPEYFPDPWRIGPFLPQKIQNMEPFDLNSHEKQLLGVDSLW